MAGRYVIGESMHSKIFGRVSFLKSAFTFFIIFLSSQVFGAYSDLLLSGSVAVSPTPITAGNTLTVSLSIKNQGLGNAPGSTTRVQIKNAALTATIADLDFSTAAITAGQTINQNCSVPIPSGTAAGTYAAYIVLDRYSTANEGSNYANDYGSSSAFTINAALVYYTVSTISSPSAGGTTGGGGSKASGSSCMVTASANSGYTFVNWTENGNPVSTSSSYTFTVTGNRTLVANFTQNSVYYTITTSSSPSAGGTTGGGGSKLSGSSATVTASANSGYTFVNWTENGNQVSTSSSYTFTVSGDRTLVANFTQNSVYYSITTSSSPSAGGTTGGGGSKLSGSSATVTASANSGYTFVNWTENGNQVSTISSYTFTVSSSRTLVANFITTSGDLSFKFPLASYTPYTAPVSSVFDHSGSRYIANNEVVSFTGEKGTVKDTVEPPVVTGGQTLYSYKKVDGTVFSCNGNYVGTVATGSKTLNYDGHPGWDYAVGIGTPVYAVADGQVVLVTSDSASGNYIRLQHGTDYQSQYLHLSEQLVVQGANVAKGQLIGKSGNSGGVGAHLHFEVKKNVSGTWVSVDPYGWTGAGADPYQIANTKLWEDGVSEGADYPGASWQPAAAPNYEVANRSSSDVRWIVIHTTEGTTATAVQRFQNPAELVSAHYIISRDGSIIQLVKNKDIAFAAGNYAYNQKCINIEHERYGTSNCTEVQLAASANLVKWLLQRYNVSLVVPSGIMPADPSAASGIIGHIQVPDPYNPTLGGGASHHTDPVNWVWSSYQSLLSISTYTITVSAAPSAGGIVGGNGTFASGSSRTVTASANSGYTFVNWTENGSQVSTSSSYTFTASGNRTLVANFTQNPVSYTITTSSGPLAGGTTGGGGSKLSGSSATVIASANSGYTFASWTENGSQVSTSSSYTFTVSGNRALVANFTQNPVNYTITTSSSPSAGGTTSGGGGETQRFLGDGDGNGEQRLYVCELDGGR
jgi:uncharacterized repeat protein (TIGR02543 family)